MNIEIRKAKELDLSELAALFCCYLDFYHVTRFSQAEVGSFLRDRMAKNDSEILVAVKQDKLVGFIQLYPTFSSLSLKRQWILNDLFVARALINAAKKLSLDSGAKGLVLMTGVDNIRAQKLYEQEGWKKLENFYSYFFNH